MYYLHHVLLFVARDFDPRWRHLLTYPDVPYPLQPQQHNLVFSR